MKRLVLICILLMCFSSSFADNLYVPSVDYPTIQSAIIDANDGDTVIVSPGRYKENINFLDRAITVTSTDPNDPNIVAATIIDGNEPNDVNFASTVTFNSGEDNNSVLTGFTITGGTGTWVLLAWEYKGQNWSRCGGGITCYNISEPTITKNIITGNVAGQGGGIFAYGNPVNPNDPSNPPVHIRPVIKDNIFFENNAVQDHGFTPPDTIYPHFDRGDGGAIAGFQGCDAVVQDNVVFDNYAFNYGGGIRLRQWSDMLISNNEITNNNGILGGGIHASYTCSPVITENIIALNTSRGLGSGGISLYYNTSGIITYNTILLNKVDGVGKGGGISVCWNSSATIENNIIAKNSAYLGGGIYAISESTLLKNNTIVKNNAEDGGGLYLDSSINLTATGNIIASNTGAAQIYKTEQSTLDASYNNVWSEDNYSYSPDMNDLTGINGNISEDPKLASADTNDFSLTVYSPCINAGDPNFITEPNQKDINGDDRIIGQHIDIGADETWPVWNITSGTKYSAIQQAIDDSNDKDTIIAGRSRYLETINFGTKNLILSSSDPNNQQAVEKTIIDANNKDTAVVIAGGQDANTIFRGFTVTGGDAQDDLGGGISCYASPRIKQNIIQNNNAYIAGGGLYFYNCSPSVTNNRITNNSSYLGGAAFCDVNSEVTLTNNQITDNFALLAGGGICYDYSAGRTWIINNEIIANNAMIGGGLAIQSNANNINVYGNLFCGNYASDSGGAILTLHGEPNIINNSIVNNRSTTGSGIYIEDNNSPLIVNNIIAFNQLGHGIYCSGSEPYPIDINSNDVYGNELGNYGGVLGDQTGTNGNISVDPNLVNIGFWDDPNTPADINDDVFISGNYHLFPISACIDAADSNFLPSQLQTDIDGEERTFDGRLDIGADEVVFSAIDLNRDGIVNYYELTILTGEWLQSGPELQSDFYDDDFIDFLDFAELANQWFATPLWYQE